MLKKQKDIPILKAVDFFCCSGGVTHGFQTANIDVLGGIDIAGEYKETYELNNPGSKFIQADIATLQPHELESQLDIKKDMDNLIFIGCSPCQYYTTIQTDKTKSSKGRLLLEEFKRFVEYFSPGYIFIENVPGLEKKNGTPLSNFKDFLSERNYVFSDKVINAAEYNVPQNRKRYVLIATRVNNRIIVPKGHKSKSPTVRDAIGSFRPICSGYKDKNVERKHWTAGIKPINLKRLQKTKHDGGTRLEWKDDPELQLNCYVNKDMTFKDVYGRMHWDRPSPTITTKFFSISNGRFGHPEQDRALSLREGARLQSFPMNYNFISSNFSTVARMIGNAVPPQMAKKIGIALIKNYLNGTIQSKS